MKKEEIDRLIKDKLIDLTEGLCIQDAITDYIYTIVFDAPDYDIIYNIEDYLYDKAYQDSEIIYYDDAWEVLKHDFDEACRRAYELGYTLNNITLTTLASIYNSELILADYLLDFSGIKDELKEFLDELEEEIQNEEEDDNEE